MSSPLVLDDAVIVYTDELVAYDLDTGDPRWFGAAGGEGYSYHPVLVDDVLVVRNGQEMAAFRLPLAGG